MFASYPILHSRLTFWSNSSSININNFFISSKKTSGASTRIIQFFFISFISKFLTRFLTRSEFDQLSTSPTVASATTPRCRLQIIQWRSLEIGAVFRVIDRITIPTAPEPKHYVILETEQQQIIHVWITPTINGELSKYNLSLGNIFIKPLGKKTLNTTGNEYFNFDIVLDVNNINFI